MSMWRHCSSCRASIEFEQIYWECSVSTCARVARQGLFFCSVGCWESHLPTMRHRDAWAIEKRAPTESAWRSEQAKQQDAAAAPAASRVMPTSGGEAKRQVVAAAPRATTSEPPRAPSPDDDDILIVVSKLKKYIRNRSGMNTSDTVMPALSDHVRRLCDAAIRRAAEDGRKTVLDRDLDKI